MNQAEQISRLQSLLARVQKRAKEPRVPASAPQPTVAASVAAAVEVTAPVKVDTPASAPPPVFVAPGAASAVESTRDFDVSTLGIAPAGASKAQPAVEPEAPTAAKPTVVQPVDSAPELEFEALVGLEEEGKLSPKEPTPLPPSMAELEEPPASSKRPKAPEREFAAPPQTPPPESGPQQAQASGRLEALEVDFEPKRLEPLTQATVEQLGQTVELDKPTEHLLELAPPAPTAVVKPAEPVSEMEAEIQSSMDEVFARETEKQAPAAAAALKQPEAELELEELGPAEVAGPPAAAAAPEKKVKAVQLVAPSSDEGMTETVTVEVHAGLAARRGVAAGSAAAFVGAVRTFRPEGLVELLDESLKLGE